jgi:hypothetical protein
MNGSIIVYHQDAVVFEGIDAHRPFCWLNRELKSEICSLSEAIALGRECFPISFAAKALLLRPKSPPALWCSCFMGASR